MKREKRATKKLGLSDEMTQVGELEASSLQQMVIYEWLDVSLEA